MDYISALSALNLDEINIKLMVLFQNKNMFLGFAYEDAIIWANNMTFHLLSSIVDAHSSIIVCNTPVNNQSNAFVHDCLTQVLQKVSIKNYYAG